MTTETLAQVHHFLTPQAFIKALSDRPLTNPFWRSFGPSAPDTIRASMTDEQINTILARKKDDILPVLHTHMPKGPYPYQSKRTGDWGDLYLWDDNCDMLYPSNDIYHHMMKKTRVPKIHLIGSQQRIKI